MGYNIPQKGSGMKLNYAFRISQCFNWGVFSDFRSSLFSLPRQNRITIPGSLQPSFFIRKYSKDYTLERIFDRLSVLPAVTKNYVSQTVFEMNNIPLNDYEAQLLLDGYQVIHKITRY